MRDVTAIMFDPVRAREEIRRILAGANYAPNALEGLSGLISDMAQHGHRRTDPVRSLMSNLGNRWSMLILLVLDYGPFRYAVLQKLINALVPPGEHMISQRIMTLQLRELERDGLVNRAVIEADSPQVVEYSLTQFGSAFLGQAVGVIAWINKHADDAMTASTPAAAKLASGD